jgi:transposase
MTVHVGIDIACKTFDMVALVNEKSLKVEQFKQTPQGHQNALKRLQALNPERIVMEATGIYYLDLATALANAKLPVSVINPKSFHHFAQLKLSSTKTDPIDAGLLAEFAQRMQPQDWTPPDPQYLTLRDFGRQINRLTGVRTQARNRLHALKAKNVTAPLIIQDEEEGIEMLDRRIGRLADAAKALIIEHPALSKHWHNVLQATGIGETAAIAILAELCVLPESLKANQVSRFAGLDVRIRQSGTSVNSPARLGKAGNAYLRAALFMPAMCAVKHDERARAFHQALVGRGKAKMQSICAVMRKYLTGIWACMKTGQPFDSAKLFNECHLKS